MSSPAARLGQSDFTPGGIFSADALDANRSGRLTDVQRREYGGMETSRRKGALGLAGVFAALGVLVGTAPGPAPNAWARPIAAIAFVAIAAVLVLYAMTSVDALSRDLGRGRVEMLEGAMEKHHESTYASHSTNSTRYYLDVADRHFETGRSAYEAAPEHGYVRVYYLPSSHKVVNLERLADPPLPNDGVLTRDDLMTTLREVGHSKGEEHHEAMARLAQMGETLKAVEVRNPTPPSTAAPAPGALAQALVGTWQGGPFTVVFTPDGTAELRPIVGRPQQGHWSIDAQGKLHADLMGREAVGDAWIDGDTLTLSIGGEGIRLRRAQ